MTWLNPAAFGVLIVVVVPLILHMLLRDRARRVSFPTIRFIPSSDQSSARLHVPSDPLFLMIRMAILAAAALAFARPLFFTGGRVAAWQERTSTAIVVDTRAADPESAHIAATSEARGSAQSRTFAGSNPGASIDRAVAWLTGSGPGRRELVLLSGFTLGSISAADLVPVPRDIGIRMVRVPQTSAESVTDAGTILHGAKTFRQRVRLDGLSTSVSLIEEPTSSAGVNVVLASGADDNGETLRFVASSGVAAPARETPVVVRVSQTATPAGEIRTEWIRRAARRLAGSPVAAHAALQVGEEAGALVVDAKVPDDSWLRAAILEASLDARRDPDASRQHELQKISSDRLSAWSRPPGTPASDGWQHTDASDGRWFWALALLLIGVESVLRRIGSRDRRGVDTRAA